MKKVLSLIAILCMALVCFVGCDFLPTETPCEHDWTDATCVAPKTCSVCGATEGEPDALNHTPEEDDGNCATAVKCANEGCEHICVAAAEHTPEEDDGNCTTAIKCANEGCEHICVAGAAEHTPAADDGNCTTAIKCANEGCEHVCVAGATAHTPKEDDGNCETEIKCANEGCTQDAVAAKTHTPEDDDKDVTTAVKCANEGCDHVIVEAKEAITLTIPEFANGAVVADKKNYAIGDTVNLTINPEWSYAQKLYINGEALILPWNNNIYTFVVNEDNYEISGTFELSLDLDVKDATRWETGNQAHGILTTYYPANGDSWWIYVKGNYSSITIKAKNYLSLEDSKDYGDTQPGYQQLLGITINGNASCINLAS